MVVSESLNTFIEATISQTGDGVGNRDARQAPATREATNSQTGDGVGNRGVSTATQHRICGSLDDGIAIFARIINRVSWFYYNTFQTATRREAIFPNSGDGVGNRDARQAPATREAIFSQTGDCISFSVHWDGLRYYNRSFITRRSHAGSFVFLVKIVENAIQFHIVRPSGEDSQEEGKE